MRAKALSIALVTALLVLSAFIMVSSGEEILGENGTTGTRNATIDNINVDSVNVIGITAYGYFGWDECTVSVDVTSTWPGGIQNATLNLSIYDSSSLVFADETNCSAEGITLENTQTFNTSWTPLGDGQYHFNFSVHFDDNVTWENVSFDFQQIIDVEAVADTPYDDTQLILPANVDMNLKATNRGNDDITSIPYMVQVYEDGGGMVSNESDTIDLTGSPLASGATHPFTYDWTPTGFGDFRLVYTYNWTDFNASNNMAETTINLTQAWDGNFTITIKGTVTDLLTTDVIQDCLVEINGTMHSTNSNETGAYNFTDLNLPGGLYDLVFTKAGYDVIIVELNVSDNVTFVEDVALNMSTAPLGTIAGVVNDGLAGALAGATVTLYNETAEVDFETTNTTGHYTFDDLEAGTYRLTFSAVGYSTDERTDIAVDGAVVNVATITLYALADIDVSFSIPDGDDGVDPNEEFFTIEFSQAVDTDTINVSTFFMQERGGAVVAGDIDPYSDTEIDFLPDAPLAEGKWYDVTLTTDVRDANGAPFLAADWVSSFKTLGGEITITMITPVNDATDVALDTAIVITSSAPINASTLTPNSTLTLAMKGAALGVDFTLSPDGMTLTVIPLDPLIEGTHYEIVLQNVKTVDGENIEITFAFTTITTVTTATVTGVLSNETGPLAGVTVYLQNDDDPSTNYTTTTTATGTFTFLDVEPGNYTMGIIDDENTMIPEQVQAGSGVTEDLGPVAASEITQPVAGGDGEEDNDLPLWVIILLIVLGVICLILFILLIVAAVIMGGKKEEVSEEGGTVRASTSREWDGGGDFGDVDASTFQCPNCGAYVDDECIECPECGVEFEDDLFECPNCGATLESEAEVCPNCDYVFGEDEAEEEEDEYYDDEYDEESEYDEDIDVEVEEEDDYSYNTSYDEEDDYDYDYEDDDY